MFDLFDYGIQFSNTYITFTGVTERRGTTALSVNELATLRTCETTFVTDANHV